MAELRELLDTLVEEVSRLTVAVDEVRGTEAVLSAEMGAALFNSSPDAIVVVDDGSRINLFNAQAELLFGYPRSEVVGHPVEVLLPEGVRGRHVGHRDGYLAAPVRRPMGLGLHLVARHKSGGEIPVDINLAPIVTTGGTFVIATVRRRPTGSGGEERGGSASD